ASLPTTRQAGVRRGANAACRTADLAHTRLCHACRRARNHSLRLGTIPEVHADASATGKIRDISSLRRLQMRKTAMYFISLLFLGAVLMALAQNPPQQTPQGQSTPGQQAGRGGAQPAPTPPGPNPNSQYRLGPDSMPQEGVPKGEIRGPYTLPSNAYPGTQHTYWVYVPAQYDPAVPAALMVHLYNKESATSLIAPSGQCKAYLPYWQEGVLAQTINLEEATGLLATRYAPERYHEFT